MKRQLVLILVGLSLALMLWRLPARHRTGSTVRHSVGDLQPRGTSARPSALAAGPGSIGNWAFTTNDTNKLDATGAPGPSGTPETPRKRAWDVAFFSKQGAAKEGESIRFELAGGLMASGTVRQSSSKDGQVVYVSGELTEPEPGRFFFQKQTRAGVAGDFVGIVELPASGTAYRIEPTGPGKTPELVERPLGAVLCVRMPRSVATASKPARKRAGVKFGKLTDAPIPPYQQGIVVLESLHGSVPVIYLDFAGGYTSTWGGIAYARPEVSNSQIREVWSRVTEDYLPFNINVTTDLQVYENAPDGSRQRVIITPTDAAAPEAGGVAYIGSFNWSREAPCWVFMISGKDCAEACSHEAGHTLGLTHEGQIINGTNYVYYYGQGSGETGWAPIMGVGFYENVSQWSKGEYIDANNPQDQLNVIASWNNNVTYRLDDTGDTLATSRYLELYSNYSASAQGVIERTADTDAFQFTTSGGLVSLRADPASEGPDLAIEATLCDASDTVLAASNPQDTLWASLTTNLPAGTYTFRVAGAGRNDPLTNGFSNYASLGYYSITGSVANARLPTRFQIPEHVVNGTIVGTVPPGVSNGDSLGYAILSGNTGNTFAIDSSGTLTVADNTLLDYGTLASQGQFTVQFELFVNITDLQNGSLRETNRRVVVAVMPVPPMITVGPRAVEAPAGSSISLSATATSPGASWLQFQWLFNGLPLPGAYASTLVLTNIQSWNSGEYLAVVMDAFSSATSQVANVTVNPVGPVIVVQPQAQAAFPGLGATFNCVASGSEPFSYQWQFNGDDLAGATQAQLALTNISPQQAGIYGVVVTNSMGNAVSAGAALEMVSVAAWGWDSAGQADLHSDLTNVVQVAAGAVHSLALRRDGSVFAWGATNLCDVPAGLSNVVAIAAAADHSLALKSDGTVTAWGDDSTGQLDLPPGATSIVAIAAGPNCTLALNSSGQVLACGQGTDNPLGPPPVLTNIVAIAAGSNHCLALRADGGVIAWGDDRFGQSDVPTNLNNIVAIAAGDSHSMALRSDGTVVGWGNNTNGQIAVPDLLTNVVGISAGAFNSFALRADGTLVGWGAGAAPGISLYPDCGQSSVPASVTNVAQVSCGAAHTLALVGDGAPFIATQPVSQFTSAGSQVVFRAATTGAFPISYQWQFMGTNLDGATNQLLILQNVSDANAGLYGVLVSNSFGVVSSAAVQLTVATSPFVIDQPQDTNICVGTSGSMQVVAGGLPPFYYQWLFNGMILPDATNSMLAFSNMRFSQEGEYAVIISNASASITILPAKLSISQVAAWGLGDGPTDYVNNYGQTIVPPGLTGVAQVAAGTFHSLALKSDSTVVAWGAGSRSSQPLKSADYGQCSVPAGLSNVVAIAAGRYHSLALTQQGQVIAWGAGTTNANIWPDYGQSKVPTGLDGVIAIAAGDYISVAVKHDSTVVVWGFSEQNGITNAPVRQGVVSVASRGTNILALTYLGAVYEWLQWGWGETYSNVAAIAAGGDFSLVLRTNGTVVGWGSLLPPQGLTNVMEIAAGEDYGLAVKNDGTIVTWGQTNGNLTAVPGGLSNVVDIAGGQYHSLAAVGDAAITIRNQPVDQTVFSFDQAYFTVAAVGAQPLEYQWRHNGKNIPGGTKIGLEISGQPFNAGDYQVVVTNNFGAVTSRVAKLSVVLTPSYALSTPGLTTWITSGDAAWFGETNVTYHTAYAVQSGAIAEGQQSTLQTTNVIGPGSLGFWWKVSCQQAFDSLSFYLDNVKVVGISGELDWQQQTIAVPAGSHALAWVYEKNGSVPSGQDCGWLDQIAFTLDPPVITSQPTGQVVMAGQPVQLSVSATGTPPLAYLWLKDGTNLPHRSSSQLSLPKVTKQDAGTYQVVVSHPGAASILSRAAVLDVISPQRIVKASWQPDGSFQLVSADNQGIPLQPDEQWQYQAQVSTNLVDWTPLPTPTELWFGSLLLFDPYASNSTARFYRVVQLVP
jgi:alpha-tubulin suppressor-like RCC1 family protein